MFSGCATALITPFHRDGSIDEEGLRLLVSRQEEKGIDAVVPCGTTGESATLSHEEHLKVIGIVLDQVKRAKVIAGAGSNSTQEAVHLSKGAEDLGADYLLSITPYYNKPTQRGIVNHYSAIAEAVDVPIIVYNVPGRTGINIQAETTLKLAAIPGVDGIKEASGDLGQVMKVLQGRPGGFSVISGEDWLTYSLMGLGADGVISVTSNIMPDIMSEMVHASMRGDMATARELHFRLLPLFDVLFIETNPIPAKTALGMMGLPSGALRPPLCELLPESEARLRAVLESLSLL